MDKYETKGSYIQTLRLYILKFGETVVNNKSYQTLGKELSEYKAFKCS